MTGGKKTRAYTSPSIIGDKVKSKYIFNIFFIIFSLLLIEKNCFAKDIISTPYHQLAVQAFYPDEKNKNFPIILLVPNVGQGPKDYKLFSQNLASEGYLVLTLDLSNDKFLNTKENFDPDLTEKMINHIHEILNYSKNLPDFKNISLNHLTIIGVQSGATIATAYAARNKISLISIQDPTDGDTLPEGSWKNFALFIFDKNASNAKYYNNWIKYVNAQEWLAQVGKKPFYKQWVTIIHMPLSITPTDENYDKFNKYNNPVMAWLQKYK